MDPLLRSQYDEYTKTLESSFKRGIDRHFAHEKFLMTLYRHAQVWTKNLGIRNG